MELRNRNCHVNTYGEQVFYSGEGNPTLMGLTPWIIFDESVIQGGCDINDFGGLLAVI